MTPFVTLDEVKARLRIDAGDDDATLTSLIDEASSAVADYMKYVDGDVPPRVKAATIMLVGILYNKPDSDSDGLFEGGSLPGPVRALLSRKPTMA